MAACGERGVPAERAGRLPGAGRAVPRRVRLPPPGRRRPAPPGHAPRHAPQRTQVAEEEEHQEPIHLRAQVS